MGVAPEEVLDFSASINPLGMPRTARRMYHQALRKVVYYPEPAAESLTQALGDYHDLDPAGVVVGNGSTQLIYLIARVLPARRVLLVAPLFSEHEAAWRARGAQVEYFLLRPPSFSLALDRLGASLSRKRYDALVVTNPNSPTGALTGYRQLEDLARLCRQLRTRLIVDETFVDWVEEESLKHLAFRAPHVIALRSLTKFFALPGLRAGYVIAHPRVIRQLRARLEPWSVNVAAQEVGKACLQDQRFIEHSRRFMKKERVWLFSQLRAMPELRVFPSSANFFLIQLTTQKLDALRLADRLAHERLLIRVCGDFIGLGQQFFRIAVRKRFENLYLLDCLRSAFQGEKAR